LDGTLNFELRHPSSVSYALQMRYLLTVRKLQWKQRHHLKFLSIFNHYVSLPTGERMMSTLSICSRSLPKVNQQFSAPQSTKCRKNSPVTFRVIRLTNRQTKTHR